VDGNIITCPFHGSKFDMCTGENLDCVTGIAGTKGAVVMEGVFIYLWVTIYNHPNIASPKGSQSISASATKQDFNRE
jgi:hypothetical protein